MARVTTFVFFNKLTILGVPLSFDSGFVRGERSREKPRLVKERTRKTRWANNSREFSRNYVRATGCRVYEEKNRRKRRMCGTARLNEKLSFALKSCAPSVKSRGALVRVKSFIAFGILHEDETVSK